MSEREDYLARLRDRLPLPPEEADEAIAEVAAHLDDATADLVERGVSPDAAEHLAAERLGSPDALASEIARAHRSPRDLIAAAGVGLRVTVGTGLWSLLEGWAIIVLILIAGSLSVSLLGRVIGHELPWGDWAPSDATPLTGAVILGLAAFAVGRALPPAVARAARRTDSEVRPALLSIGVILFGAIGLFAVRAEFGPPSAVATALLPAWFALGMLAPRVLPSWFPGRPRKPFVILLWILIGLVVPVMLLYAAQPVSQSGSPVEATPAQPDWSRIAPLWSSSGTMFSEGSSSQNGAQVDLAETLQDPAALDGWTSLNVEIWRGGPAPRSGPYLPNPVGPGPISSWPLEHDDSLVSASVRIDARPETGIYLVAMVGTAPNGQRYLLDGPSDALVSWSGSVWEYVTSPR